MDEMDEMDGSRLISVESSICSIANGWLYLGVDILSLFGSFFLLNDLGLFISVRLGGNCIGSFLTFDIICLIMSSVSFLSLLVNAFSTLWSPVGPCICCDWMLSFSVSSVISILGFWSLNLSSCNLNFG